LQRDRRAVIRDRISDGIVVMAASRIDTTSRTSASWSPQRIVSRPGIEIFVLD
jgi:hypothetical protein